MEVALAHLPEVSERAYYILFIFKPVFFGVLHLSAAFISVIFILV